MPNHSCSTAPGSRLVGDPVDTLTGAVFIRKLEFRLTGPLELWWYRHYDSSQNNRCFAFGCGHTHDFDRVLYFEEDQIRYEAPVGLVFDFPILGNDGDEVARHGFVLRRLSAKRYQMTRHGEPAMEFERLGPLQTAHLIRIFRGEHEILLNYDGAYRLERIIDSTARVISVAVRTDGRIESLVLENGSREPGKLLVAYQYDERGNLVATKNDLGYGYFFSYDHANRMLMRRGRMGFRFHFTYDEQGRCVLSEGDDQLYGVALNYKVPDRLTLVTRADGGVWGYHFDDKGALIKIVDPLGGVQKLIRNESGQLALELDPNGNATQYEYDAAGAPVIKVDPLGHRIPLPEDLNAPDPLAERVAANPAECEYGRLLNVPRITLPSQKDMQELQLVSHTSSLVFVRSEQEGDAKPKKRFDVPPLGYLWWPKPKLGRIFNDLGQLTLQRDEFGRQRRWSYDASGNVTDFTDFDGGKWKYDNGTWHLLLGATNPLGAEIRLTYTTNAEVASCVDAGGTRSDYRYDFKDHLVEVRRHGVVRDTYTRDSVGNLIAKHASDGRELLRIEIGSGNLRTKCTLASGDEHTFQYDKAGQQLIADTKKDHVEFAYDELGNCVLEKRNGIGVEHQYQGWRRPKESVFFGRFKVKYEWCDKNTLIITDPSGASHKIQFYGHGLVERHFSNGSREFSQYDVQGRCLLKLARRVASSVWSRRYHWSGEGELKLIEDSLRGTVRHEYDSVHRLCRRYVNSYAENYEMDFADNLVAQPGLTGVTLREGNRLKTANSFSFDYNDRNHVEVRQNQDSNIQYTYDSRDQLIRVETSAGNWEAEYDAHGRRTRKTWVGQTTEYYWNGDQLIAEINSDNKLRLYIYTDPLAHTPLLFFDYDSLEAPLESCQRYIIYSDQIGTPYLIEDEHGKDVWSANIAPFGNVTVTSDAEIEFNLRFPGHYFDSELNLHYNRFRYYDPELGRYLQSDPWGLAGGYNLYAYCSNPLDKVDVRGLGEGNQSNGEGEDGAEGPPPPGGRGDGDGGEDGLMPREDAEALARQRLEEYRDFLQGEIDAGRMSQADAGPVVACTVDRRTGETFVGHNNRNGDPPDNLNSALEPDLAAAQADPQHPSSPGSHAEVYSTNDALNAREDATGRPVTQAERDEFTQVSEWRRGSGGSRMQAGEDAPRCGNCQVITDGVDNRSGDAPPMPPE